MGNIVLIGTNPNQSFQSPRNEKHPSTSTLGINLSPFFAHLEEDMELYLQLNDSVDGYNEDFFHHAFTNNAGFSITDYTHYASDLIYFLLGFKNTLADFETIDYTNTPLWDSSDGGFFTSMDRTLTAISEEKTVFDNLLYILALLEGTEYLGNPTNLVGKITTQWNAIVNEFWDDTNNAFDHSTEILTERYASDNFLGAFVAFSISKSSLFTNTFRNQVKQYGLDIMTGFASSMYDSVSGRESFYNTSDLTNVATSDYKYLYSNALGILALLEYNIQNGYEKNSIEVQQAEYIWRFLNQKFFNSTYNMYMTETNFNGNILRDWDLYLLENAWMMKSTLNLFKHTGNTTYYDKAMELFNGIEHNIYDSVNGGYNTLIGSSVKTLDSYSMLLYTLQDFYNIFTQSEINVVLNQTEYIYQIDEVLNFTLSYNITMEFSYPAVGESWTISAPIENASIKYILRYAENNTIISINTSTTNAYGQHLFLYDITNLTSLYDYKLNILCNRTGFNAGTTVFQLPLSSGIDITKITPLFDILHQGESALINITYTSSRPDDIDAITTTSGENFVEQSSTRHIIKREDEIEGKIESSIITNITVRGNAELGNQFLEIIVLNNISESIYLEKYELEIYSTIEVVSILVDQYLVAFSSVDVILTLRNHRRLENESLNIEINGSAFVYSNFSVQDIAPQSVKNIVLSLTPNENTKMGPLHFMLTIWRFSINIYSQEFTINAVPEVDILEINSDNLKVIQGQSPTVTIRLFNYNESVKQIRVTSNGNEVLNRVVPTGESLIQVNMAKPIRNPYNIGELIYELNIYDSLGNLLATKVITVDIKPSPLNIFLFYVLPILIPIGVVVYFKYKESEQNKRMK